MAQCQQVWKPMLCFLDMLLFFWQANTFFQALPITKYNIEDKNRLGSERKKWHWCLLLFSVTQINSDIQSSLFTCLHPGIHTLLVSLCLTLPSDSYSTYSVLLSHATSWDFRISLFGSPNLLYNHFYFKSLVHLLILCNPSGRDPFASHLIRQVFNCFLSTLK